MILQGEFAVLLAQTLRLRAPRGGWSPAGTTAFLATLRLRRDLPAGLAPAGGWSMNLPLTEGALASILNAFGLHVISRNPLRELTAREAEEVLVRLASFFRVIAPSTYTTSTLPALQLGNPRAPMSPFTP